MEIPLKRKYRTGKQYKQQKGGGNNQGTSMGKHVPHPHVPGFKRNGYRCEPRWNPKEAA